MSSTLAVEEEIVPCRISDSNYHFDCLVEEEEIIPLMIKIPDINLDSSSAESPISTQDDDINNKASHQLSILNKRFEERGRCITRYENIIKELNEKNSALESNLQNANMKIRELSQLIKKKDQVVHFQEAQLDKNIDKVEALEKSLTHFCDENAILKNQSKVDTQVTSAEKKRTNLEKDMSRLHEKFNVLETKVLESVKFFE